MQYTKLADTNLDISRICLGTMTWGYQNTLKDGHEQMDYALAEGVNFWDTAEMYAVPPTKETYGTTETIIGEWFAKNGRRDDVILASKIAPELPHIRGGNTPIDRPNLQQALDNSLKRLKTDYIDLYQLHWPSNRNGYHFQNHWQYTPRHTDKSAIIANKIEILETLEEFIKAGKIRHWGLSNDTAWGITQYCQLAEQHNLSRPVSLQHEYSLLCRRDDTDVAEACMIEGLSYLPWSPIGMGILSGKYLGNEDPEKARLTFSKEAKERYSYRLTENVQKATERYVELARSENIDPSQLAIAFCLTRPFVTSPIIGATNLDQLKNNIDAINIKLSEETLGTIDTIYRDYPVPF